MRFSCIDHLLFHPLPKWDREYTHQKNGEALWFRVVVFCTDIQGEKKYILDLSDRTKDRKINQRLEDAVYVAESELTGVKILPAEDDDLNAEIAMVQLEELGLQVTRVADGSGAVKTFAENPTYTFNIIFMDIMMPKMNGYEATAAIRAMRDRPDAQKIPIIAMTANAFAEDVQASLDVGMNGHLSKPVVMEEVIKAIARNVNS